MQSKRKAELLAENATLARKLREAEAQMAHVFHFAKAGIMKAGRDKIMGSGIIVQIHYLGGREVCPPFVLKDGMSPELIAAFLECLKYGYERTTEFKP